MVIQIKTLVLKYVSLSHEIEDMYLEDVYEGPKYFESTKTEHYMTRCVLINDGRMVFIR